MINTIKNKIIAAVISVLFLFNGIAPAINGGISVAYAMEDSEAVAQDLNAVNALMDAAANGTVEYDGVLSAHLVQGDDENIKYLMDSLHLPIAGNNGSTITWSSTNEAVINPDGGVIRPDDTDAVVGLTATVSKGSESMKSSTWEFTVPALSTVVGTMPTLSALNAINEFNSESEDDVRLVKKNADTSGPHEGFYELNGTDGKASTLTIYSEADKTDSPNGFYSELVMKKTEGTVNMRFWSSKNDWMGYMKWANSGNLIIQAPTGTAVTTLGVADIGKVIKLGIWVDLVNHSYRLWINGKSFVSDKYGADLPLDKNNRGVNAISFEMADKSSLKSAKIDSYRFYSVELTDEYKANDDLNSLTEESLLTKELIDGKLNSPLSLPTEGKYSTISWTAEPEGIISVEDGSITNPDEDTAVTLTALAECNGMTREKKFTFTVKAKIAGAEALAADKAALTKESLLCAPLVKDESDKEYLIDSLRLPAEGLYGTKIVWSCSNPDVIKTDGTVIRPEEPVETVTLTATLTKDALPSEEVTFTFDVASLDSGIGGPKLEELIAVNDFNEDTSKDKRIHKEVGQISEADGYLKLATSASVCRTYIYANEDRSTPEEPLYIEFTLERMNDDDSLEMWLLNFPAWATSPDYRQLQSQWNTNGISFKNGSSGSSEYSGADTGKKGKYRLGFYIDNIKRTYSIWINGKEIAHNYKMLGDSVKTDNITFYIPKNSGSTALNIDSYRIYKPVLSDEYKVGVDVDALKEAELLTGTLEEGKLTTPFNLPEKGKYCSISWSVDPEGIISAEDGSITRPDSDTLVTLTAKVSSGDYSETKEFSFNVMKKLDDNDKLMLDYNALTDESIISAPFVIDDISGTKYITESLNLPSEARNGSRITWESKNKEFLTDKGVFLKRPAAETAVVEMVATFICGTAEPMQKTFSFNIPSMNSEIGGIPELISLTSVNEFNNDALEDGRVTQRYGTEVLENGVMHMPGGSNTLGTYIYTEDDHTTSELPFYCEFVVDRLADNDSYQIWLMDYKTWSPQAMNFTWTNMGIGYRNGSGSSNEYSGAETGKAGKYRIGFYVDNITRTYSLWINGKLIAKDYKMLNNGLKVDAIHFNVVKDVGNAGLDLDSYRFYSVKLTDEQIVKLDKSMLTTESLLTEPANYQNYLNADLKLPAAGTNGSEITWKCSNDKIDVSTGKLNRPSDMTEDVPTVLTATIKSGEYSETMEFEFIVVRNGDDADTRITADAQFLAESIIIGTNTQTNEIKEALNLISKGSLFGTDIVWTSSKPNIIAPSGRVINPKWDEAAENVTLTASIGGKVTKTFEFTVLPERYITDPQRTSDEEFFGVYDGSKWTAPGWLNYTEFPKLSKVEAAVRDGDYSKAKQELLLYMQDKLKNATDITTSRNKGLADFYANGGFATEKQNYWTATSYADSDEYKKIEITFDDPDINPGAFNTYSLMSAYRDSVELSFAGHTYPDANMRPILMVNVNGSPRYYNAVDSATIRAGQYMDTSYGSPADLKVKMMGEFVGDDTYRSLIKFDLSDISHDDIITSQTLILYGKKSNNYSEDKCFYVMNEPGNTWSSDKVTWKTNLGNYYNYNGIYEGNDWQRVPGDEVEYRYQSIRFGARFVPAVQYIYDGNEEYAYRIIREMMDFIETNEDPMYTRVLDANLRMDSWRRLFVTVINSKYMTADICTAMLKNFYTMMEICGGSTEGSKGNATISRFNNALKAVKFFEEYSNNDKLIEYIVNWFEESIDTYYYEDGSYFEDTSEYNRTVLNTYVPGINILKDMGVEMSEKFDRIMNNAAYFALLMQGPNGERTGYGDSEIVGSYGTNSYSDIVRWYNDYELEFIDSRGTTGVEPSWTSRLFPDSSFAFLRSDWSTTAQTLMTSVRGGALHGHMDDTGIILFGYGRNLLSDTGYVMYENTDTRVDTVGTLMHNTVEIDNRPQHIMDIPNAETKTGVGNTNAFVTNDNFDFLSQSTLGYTAGEYSNIKTYSYDGHSHTRNITFIKPDFYIVSDIMTPDNPDKVYPYKQAWHMTPEAGLSVENGKVYSNFDGIGNIIIANADEGADDLHTQKGLYTLVFGNWAEPDFAYYYKEGKGVQTFDSVLLPYRNSGDVNVERLTVDEGVAAGDATALKIDIDKDGKKTTVYYMLDYKDAGKRTFGKYETDADMAVIVENSSGKIEEFDIHGGSYIKALDGSVYIETDAKVSDVSAVITGNNLNISSTDSALDISKTTIKPGVSIENLRLNGQLKESEQKDGIVTSTGTDKKEVLVNDKNPGIGVVDKPSQGGTGGSGGAGGTGGSVTPIIPDTKAPFVDIGGHWAENNIIAAHSMSIISGYPDSTFKPDNDITRAEFLTIVCRAIGLEGIMYNNEFNDVNADDWYASTIASALHEGIISRDINFRPNDNITREEMSKILTIALRMSKNMGAVPSDYSYVYTDNSDVSEWAKEYVSFVSYFKIMTGMDDGSFAPRKNATRAEAATVLSRSVNK